MKRFKTALLAAAFALATTVSFAQVGVGTGATGGAAVGTGNSGTGGATNMKSNTGVNANIGGAKAGADASGNTAIKKKSGTTTGSGAAGTSVNGSVK